MIPNPWLLLGAAIAWALSLLGTYHFAATNTANADKAAQVKALKLRDEQQSALEKLMVTTNEANRVANVALLKQLDIARDNTRTVTQQIVKEVKVYVSAQADAACVVPNGFVRVHDAAARGQTVGGDSGPPDSSDAKPSGVALSEVAEVLAKNYGRTHVLEAELDLYDRHLDMIEAFNRKLREGFKLCPR